jgi:ferredoxin
MAAKGEHLLEVAVENGINIEHACGAVCACSTCHVYIEQGMNLLSEPEEAEDDRVEEAPGLQRNSRLSCQCFIQKGRRDRGPRPRLEPQRGQRSPPLTGDLEPPGPAAPTNPFRS